jgi:hypothetical protein
VFIGTDSDTGRRIDRTATSRGTQEQTERELAAMVANVRSTRVVGVRSPMSELSLRHGSRLARPGRPDHDPPNPLRA